MNIKEIRKLIKEAITDSLSDMERAENIYEKLKHISLKSFKVTTDKIKETHKINQSEHIYLPILGLSVDLDHYNEPLTVIFEVSYSIKVNVYDKSENVTRSILVKSPDTLSYRKDPSTRRDLILIPTRIHIPKLNSNVLFPDFNDIYKIVEEQKNRIAETIKKEFTNMVEKRHFVHEFIHRQDVGTQVRMDKLINSISGSGQPSITTDYANLPQEIKAHFIERISHLKKDKANIIKNDINYFIKLFKSEPDIIDFYSELSPQNVKKINKWLFQIRQKWIDDEKK